MTDGRLLAILAGLQAPDKERVELEVIEVTPDLLQIMQSNRCFFCAELDHVDEEGFGFVPMAKPKRNASVGLVAFCVKHLPKFIKMLKPAGMATAHRNALNAGSAALPPSTPEDLYGPGALRRLKCVLCKAKRDAARQPAADVLIPITQTLDEHPLMQSDVDLLLMGLCFGHVLEKLDFGNRNSKSKV